MFDEFEKKLYIDGPIVEHFSLNRLNKYKNISASFEGGVKIFSAENGSGKTTILNALYAVLSGKYHELLRLNFESLSLKLAGFELLTANKADLNPFSSYLFEDLDFFTNYGCSKEQVGDMLSKLSKSESELFKSGVFNRFWERSPHGKEEILEHLHLILLEASENVSEEFSNFNNTVRKALSDYNILYLPTYRRIEIDFPEFDFRGMPPGVRRRQRSTFDMGEDRLIFFGLKDVQNNLNHITEEIRRGTFNAYSRISGETLDQLVEEEHDENLQFPLNLAAIKVVLARLGKSNSQTDDRITSLIETGEIYHQEHHYLRYFLGRMVEVYKEKQDKEEAIEDFIRVISSYWSAEFSEKSFEFDKLTVEAAVFNTITRTKLKLNDLSSGEKQIISVFAKLYLETEKKFIVLIDEPELSLSMQWQRKFLPDVYKADSCCQVIAITHSPFIFDNELDPYAGPLEFSYSMDHEDDF